MRDATSAGRAPERKPHPRQPPDPTPEEIAERSAEIRAENHKRQYCDSLVEPKPTKTYRLTIAKNRDRM